MADAIVAEDGAVGRGLTLTYRYGVAVLAFDTAQAPVFDAALSTALGRALDALEAAPPEGLILIEAHGRGWPAPDLSALPEAPPDTLAVRLAGLACPVIAALSGLVLGPSLALALTARGRVADARARLGFPEVGVGLVPAGGATQRLPALIGAEQALRLMMTGRPIRAAEALALGLVDEVVEGGLELAARRLASDPPPQDRRPGMRDGLAYQAAVTAARHQALGQMLPAPPRIVDCVEAAQLLPVEAGLAYEAAARADLTATETTQALCHAARAERDAARFPEARLASRPLRRIGVLGVAQDALALAALRAGWPVVLVDPARPALVAALERIAAEQERAVQAGREDAVTRDADWARLTPAMAAAALADCDLVLVAEADLLPEAVEVTPPGVVLALTGRGAATAGARGTDLLGLRPAPQGGGRLVELVVGPATAPDTVATAAAFLRRLGRAIVRSAAPGGAAERVALVGRAAALHLADAGHGEAGVAAALAGAGLGALSGPPPAGVAAPPEAPALVERVLGAMANEAARVLAAGLVQRPSDIDIALILGHGIARWQGGPCHWADQRGLLILQRDLRLWAEEAPDLWTPTPLIGELVGRGGGFAGLNR